MYNLWTIKSNSVVILVFISFSKTRTTMLKSIKNYFCIYSFLLGAKHAMPRITRINLNYILYLFTAFPVKSIHWDKNYIYMYIYIYGPILSTHFIFYFIYLCCTFLFPFSTHFRFSCSFSIVSLNDGLSYNF